MEERDLLIISILTFITVLAWIFFDAYHAYTTSTIPPELKMQIEPLNFNISLEEINELKKRVEFFPLTSTPSATKTSTPSAITR